VDLQSPIVLLKACKNPAELRGMRACHLRDAAAVVEFLASLDAHYASCSPLQHPQLGGKREPVVPLSEVQLADKLQACWARCETFVGPSFSTIAGVNENGAIIHYRYAKRHCFAQCRCWKQKFIIDCTFLCTGRRKGAVRC
jgi:Xaa-Pro aminopeptidase